MCCISYILSILQVSKTSIPWSTKVLGRRQDSSESSGLIQQASPSRWCYLVLHNYDSLPGLSFHLLFIFALWMMFIMTYTVIRTKKRQMASVLPSCVFQPFLPVLMCFCIHSMCRNHSTGFFLQQQRDLVKDISTSKEKQTYPFGIQAFQETEEETLSNHELKMN